MLENIELQYKEKVNNSYYDSLTGLYNHGIFNHFLSWEINKRKRYANDFVLGLIDVDGFCLFNRRNGAIESDLMLKKMAHIIRTNIRQSDLASHYNGDRFAFLLLEASREDAVKVSERIRAAVAAMSDNRLTVSIGLSGAAGIRSPEMEDMLNEANAALVKAKLRGKNRVAWFEVKEKPKSSVSGRILIVDDEPLNLKLLEGLLLPLGYEVVKSDSGAHALSILSKIDVDLIMLDVMMPQMDGFEVCRRIKNNEETRLIPVILVTALKEVEQRVRGIEAGADEFLTKPPNKMELIARTRSLIRVKNLNQNMASIEDVLFSLANTVEAKDFYTQGHVERVSKLAISLGKKLNLSAAELNALKIGGALHDIGKIGIPKAILNKQGPLNEEEWSAMKKHPEYGYNICLPLKRNLKRALEIVRHHHEKMDGTGYPDGLKGREISFPARIMAVADIYDALTTDRPYRKAMSTEKALSILNTEANQGKLDKDVVACLLGMMADPDSVERLLNDQSNP